ncbi:Fe-S cluster assembly protein SufD [Rhizobium leguminosarum]|uniref:Fe-S cluster assembly protein SufD n=1 Tax=Rhizobium leguminosarum TaxID=384 RepID=A0ABD7PSU2_RHILE|nr:Fe-S cluster assembly protein SufD [Rhizobium leguminosarum]TAV73898.1 Fe-S cluster assembly protein SufD [Rhizobium leguminosarum]TAV78496.1 Fe-S cluster assembly protein SufD [Rhizobium leguminosarum]TAW29910.1 Fe-S cluster assembly protein SufD [Rhizobium leguminosarum]TAW43639.1 Fe-S cluster assembly protein SufD [Rhizobium leguminosarum]TAY17247.1 Fe-S cluster assembly protein SufD [Rhizobium leguminosarum]
MNMQTTSRLTAAETALIEAFNQQIGELPGNGAVTALRDRLLDDLKKAGLPTRRIEAWHYTDLKNLLRTVPPQAGDAGSEALEPLVADATVLAVIQGHSNQKATADGLGVSAYSEHLLDGSAAGGLDALDNDDAVGRINGSFVRDGYVIDVPAETELENPLEIQFIHAGGQAHTRLPVSFGAGVKATVIERHRTVTGDAALVSHVTDITVGEGAELTWIILQQQGADDTHLGQIRIDLGADAKLRLFVINAGGRLVRQELHIKVTGEGADLTLRGINLLGGDTHTDVTMVLGHDVPNTGSTEVIRNVVFDRAKGVFQGMIRVAPDAQKTDAKMACNTLLMSDDAEFSVKPELEIFADDVQCGHGATVTDIDANHLYYMMARGIPENKARAMLVNAFVAEIVEELEDDALVEALEGVISAWLEKHA